MNKLILCFLFAISTVTASAQKVYFIYLQTESEQPFFVKMNEKVQSSSASGYLILAKLLDSTYTFTVGFPQNKWPEHRFSVTMNRKDHGFLLKNFGDKGWGLFDLQTLAVQMSSAGNAKAETPSGMENRDVSAFTEILSKAAGDPSLKEKPAQPKVEEKKPEVAIQEVVKKEEPIVVKSAEVPQPAVVVEKKENPVQPKVEEKKPEVAMLEVVKKEEPVTIKPAEVTEPAAVAIKKKEEPKEEIIEQPAIKAEEVRTVIAEEYKSSTVKKRSESSTTEGFGLVFVDSYASGENDTIRLLIPNPKPVVVVIAKEEPPKEERKLLDIPVEVVKVEEKVTESKPAVVEAPAIKPDTKIKCNETAAEPDFFKLRKSMAAAESDDEMISEAKKVFKIKCFSTSQIKNLGTLFLNDEGKYKFFDAAYNHTADAENFSSLQTELKEEYYINRFRAMLRN